MRVVYAPATQVRKIRQEQERKVMAKAASAASAAAQEKVNSIPKDAWAKLVVCLVIDGQDTGRPFYPPHSSSASVSHRRRLRSLRPTDRSDVGGHMKPPLCYI